MFKLILCVCVCVCETCILVELVEFVSKDPTPADAYVSVHRGSGNSLFGNNPSAGRMILNHHREQTRHWNHNKICFFHENYPGMGDNIYCFVYVNEALIAIFYVVIKFICL